MSARSAAESTVFNNSDSKRIDITSFSDLTGMNSGITKLLSTYYNYKCFAYINKYSI